MTYFSQAEDREAELIHGLEQYAEGGAGFIRRSPSISPVSSGTDGATAAQPPLPQRPQLRRINTSLFAALTGGSAAASVALLQPPAVKVSVVVQLATIAAIATLRDAS
jgi:hypothetical protein